MKEVFKISNCFQMTLTVASEDVAKFACPFQRRKLSLVCLDQAGFVTKTRGVMRDGSFAWNLIFVWIRYSHASLNSWFFEITYIFDTDDTT